MSALRRFVAVAIGLVLICATQPVTAAADDADNTWYSELDRDARSALERGMGFVRKFREPGQCKATVDELAGAVTSLSPQVLGAVAGLALGAAAGAASTVSVLGALRGGILLGSIGASLGHLADVLMPEQVSTLADNVQDLIQERDGRVCELIKASDKLRTPVLDHLQTALAQECRLDANAEPGALQRCMEENPTAARIFERHASVIETINQGTCRVAASLVRRFERGIAHKDEAATSLAPTCDDADPSPVLGKNIL
jgi:hypothetical protein